MKNYEAALERMGEIVQNYRFSDENWSWRYVPQYTENCEMLVGRKQYETKKDEVDKLLVDMRLDFEPNDIKYIIINDDSEIGEFVNHLRLAKGKKYSLHDMERLTTRILTTEQIRTDI